MIVGIDPGVTGAIAMLGEGKDRTAHAIPLQMLDGRLDLHWVSEWLLEHKGLFRMAALEEVHAVFGSSAGATFSFGWGLGALQGILSALKIPYTLIPPKVWQKELGIVHAPKTPPKLRKEKNLALCKQLFPDTKLLVTDRSTVPHLGCVDALLIGEAMRRKLGKQTPKDEEKCA